MSRAVLFVHGTGVRGDSYAHSFALVKQALPGYVQFSGCFWGQEQGARLAAGGTSVPNYRRTGGNGDLVEEELALWAVLYTDSWYQLRQLRDVSNGGADLPPGVESPAATLRNRIEQFRCSPELRADLAGAGLTNAFDDALAAVLATPEFDEAAQTADYEDPLEHRQAVARAVMAWPLVASDITVDGATRDALVERFIDELHGYGKGMKARLIRRFAPPPKSCLVTRSVRAGSWLCTDRARYDWFKRLAGKAAPLASSFRS